MSRERGQKKMQSAYFTVGWYNIIYHIIPHSGWVLCRPSLDARADFAALNAAFKHPNLITVKVTIDVAAHVIFYYIIFYLIGLLAMPPNPTPLPPITITLVIIKPTSNPTGLPVALHCE